MKTIEINFREPNIDRFVEIWAVSFKFGHNFYVHLKNRPKGYNQFLTALDIDFCKLKPEKESDFVVEFPEFVAFDRIFRQFEPIEEIKKRINSVVETENPVLGESSITLLKTATEKMNIKKDDIQNIISFACVVAAMDGEKNDVKAHHIAEAIQYVVPKYEENE